ncbi:histidinol-phosphate aminotransferase [Cantharellus anzutake]|uniref:histidinol-phosphate aminotransferase n=1 Tax=Cantharellus anzutake TaxID=1750568 RepID=UPI001905DD3D|nr:histidinol-phosphate aminotransferase [Cantharellus anzutake]KAF8329558.1 histidinol-phosphate aminotransferase [Cantharellus anzutake]
MPVLGLAQGGTAGYPPHFDIGKVIRPNILALQPYRCARDDYQTGVLLDANENALGHSIPSGDDELQILLQENLHRYPDPSHDQVKLRIAQLRGIPGPEYVFLGVGSDEVIDLLMRVCCTPQRDSILTTPPTYGMYAVTAQVNDAQIIKVPLDIQGGKFQPRVDQICEVTQSNSTVKLIFLCSPGNPTGTLIPLSTIIAILEEPSFKGIVVVDEAYIDFSAEGSSAVSLVRKYGNVCVMQTLSKSFALASIRLGVAIAQPPLIRVLSNTKAPYNVSGPTASLALRALSTEGLEGMQNKVKALVSYRTALISAFRDLKPLGVASVIGGNNANFLLLPILSQPESEGGIPDNQRAKTIYHKLAEECGVVVRYRGGELGCTGCLRVTVGTEDENKILLQKLRETLIETLCKP